MTLISEQRLDEVVRSRNPWWVSGTLPHSARHTQPRPCDAALTGAERAVLLAGPRRSGKTSTLMRLVESELRAAPDPRGVAYLPLDHPLLRLAEPGPLVDRVLRRLQSEGRPLVLLDGLQAVPQWPERLEELIRTRPRPRFVAAASVSPGTGDTACETIRLGPCRFREFCALRGLPDLGAPPLDPFRPELSAEADAADDRLYQRVLDPILADYLVRGGFPEALFEPDLAIGHEAIREGVVNRSVYQDLPAVVGVLRIADLERVLLAALLRGGEPLVMESFADALELDRHTVQRYLDHLGRAFLLLGLKNFAASTDRSRPRIYPADPGLANALLERGVGVLADAGERRALLAGALVAHVEEAARARGLDTAYYREGELEADVVLVSPDGAVPIVLADRDGAGEDLVAPVARLMRKMEAKRAFLLSRNGPRRNEAVTFFETVHHLPAAYFLYALAT